MDPPSTLYLEMEDSAGVETGGPALTGPFAPIWAVPYQPPDRREVYYSAAGKKRRWSRRYCGEFQFNPGGFLQPARKRK